MPRPQDESAGAERAQRELEEIRAGLEEADRGAFASTEEVAALFKRWLAPK